VIDDLVDQTVLRILDQFGLHLSSPARWAGKMPVGGNKPVRGVKRGNPIRSNRNTIRNSRSSPSCIEQRKTETATDPYSSFRDCAAGITGRAGKNVPNHRARKNGLDVAAIHHHMTGDRPVVIFLHHWGRGQPKNLPPGSRRLSMS
jgi:hypothetical protein